MNDLAEKIPIDVLSTLEQLEAAGYQSYLVGGSVRDLLNGLTPHDWDIATAAQPAQMSEALQGQRLLPTGLAYGTQTLVTAVREIQITTFRADGEYSDGRHPDAVHFSRDIFADLARRDFTVNALAYSPRHGLVDPFAGQADLLSVRLRSVGDPHQRFQEDALRIMRALRFAATLNLQIDAELAAALHSERQLLAAISPERIQVELQRMLTGQNCLPVLLEYGDVLAVFIPEVTAAIGLDQKSPWHCFDVWEHTARSIAAASPADPLVRLTLLFHDLGKPASLTVDDTGRGHFKGHAEVSAQIAATRLRQLRFDNATVAAVTQLVSLHMGVPKVENCKRWLYSIGEVQLKRLLEVKRGDVLAHNDAVIRERLARLAEFGRVLEEILAAGDCYTLKCLAVSGDDLLALGFEPGKRLGKTLDDLLQAVVDERLPNDRAALLAEAQKLKAAG